MQKILLSFVGLAFVLFSNAQLNHSENNVRSTAFKSFIVFIKGTSLSLRWETLSESNNRGFNIQRKLNGGNWQNLSFVKSQAANGNSASSLSYSYTEPNAAKGVVQYRLQQMNLDGKTNYSEIRTIQNEDICGKTTIYPNPCNGTTTILFTENNFGRDIFVSDWNGLVVKQWRGVSNDNVRVENLSPGIYMIHIIDKKTGALFNEKLVVRKR